MEVDDRTSAAPDACAPNDPETGTFDSTTATTRTRTTLLSPHRLRTLLLSICMLCTTVTFGNLADICRVTQSCPPRLIAGIVTSATSTLLSSIPILASCLQAHVNATITCVLVVALLVLQAATASFLSSPTSPIGNVIAISFSWLGVFAVFLIAFLTVLEHGVDALYAMHAWDGKRKAGGCAGARNRNRNGTGECSSDSDADGNGVKEGHGSGVRREHGDVREKNYVQSISQTEEVTAPPRIVPFKAGFIVTSATSGTASKPGWTAKVAQMARVGKVGRTTKNVERQAK